MNRVRYFGLVCSFFLYGCGSREAPAEPEPPSAIPAATLGNTALFLAGLHGPAGSAFHALEETPAWRDYAERFDKAWAGVEKDQFAQVRAFGTGRAFSPEDRIPQHIYFDMNQPRPRYPVAAPPVYGYPPDGPPV